MCAIPYRAFVVSVIAVDLPDRVTLAARLNGVAVFNDHQQRATMRVPTMPTALGVFYFHRLPLTAE